MRQRNDSGYTKHVSAWPTDEDPTRSPRDVAPLEVIDFPELLAGFTEVPPEKPPARKTAPAAPAPTEGVETP